MSNSSIWYIDRTLSRASTLTQSGPESNENEELLYISQSSRARTSSLNCLMSYAGHSLWGWGVSPLYRDAVGLFQRDKAFLLMTIRVSIHAWPSTMKWPCVKSDSVDVGLAVVIVELKHWWHVHEGSSWLTAADHLLYFLCVFYMIIFVMHMWVCANIHIYKPAVLLKCLWITFFQPLHNGKSWKLTGSVAIPLYQTISDSDSIILG